MALAITCQTGKELTYITMSTQLIDDTNAIQLICVLYLPPDPTMD